MLENFKKNITQKNIEEFIIKGFPENWFDYAYELKNAAEVLWKTSSNTFVQYEITGEEIFKREIYSRTYFLLMGIAIENLIKGILISENPKYLENGLISNEISSGHNLVELSKKIKTVSFNELENEIFKILSEVIPYWGKYPIPKKFTHLKKEIFMDKEWFKELLSIYDKLEKVLLELNHDGIKGPNNVNFPKLRVSQI